MKRNDMIRRGTALLTALCALLACSGAASAAPADRDLPIYSVGRDDNAVSLTFDAAWGNEDTELLIGILGRYGIRATFFVVGEWVDRYPESVKALHEAGHEVMNHSDTHPHFTKLSPARMTAEADACAEKIRAVTGVRPTLFRPPYGDYNDTVVSTLRQAGFTAIQWDVDSLDWKNPGPDAIVRRVLEKTRSGSILLFHNAAAQTPAALPAVIEGLLAKGFSFLPVSELIYRDNYYLDHTGRQIRIQ